MKNEKSENEDFVRALARGIQLIEAFEGSRSLTLTEAAKRTDLSRGTARRLLLTLVQLGYVGTDGHRFWLRPRLLALGHAYLSGLSLPDILLPYMEQMIGLDVQVSSSAAVLDGADAVFIAGVPAKGLIRVAMTAGLRVPATASAMGRILLADLPENELPERIEQAIKVHGGETVKLKRTIAQSRKQGYGIADGEVALGLRTVAVAVRDRTDQCVAALSLTSHDPSIPMKDVVHRFLPRLQNAAERLSIEVRPDP